MEDQIFVFAILLLLFSYFLTKVSFLAKNKHKNLPPSPPSLPILGHLHLLTKQPLIHRTFQQLSSKYGSIFSLNLGFQPCIIISSPKEVEECFTKYDIVLANRPKVLVGKHLHYDFTTLGAASYGPLWLNLRRITNQELLSGSRMSYFAEVRAQEVGSLVKGLFGMTKEKFTKVDMNSKFQGLTFNILTRMLTGKRYFNYIDDITTETTTQRIFIDPTRIKEGNMYADLPLNLNNEEVVFGRPSTGEFFEIMREVFELNGVSSMVADVFPFLRWFQSVERRMIKTRRKMDDFLDGLIEECRRNNKNIKGGETNMVYKLLNLRESEPENYSNDCIKGIIMIMLTAGTDTSSATIEWALALLLNHPNILQKAREHIDKYKTNGELIQESDLPHLPYIQSIINETLRLFPVAPLLVGHVPSMDISISGYHIDKGKLCLINAWAIHRDPNLWENPLEFRPERFDGLKSEEYKYSWIPFGLGRRSCPGASLANRVIGLALANLIQCFDWETIGGKEVDLSEGVGLTMPMAKPLEAMCRSRKSKIDILTNIQ